MRKRRKKREVSWGPLLWIALVANTAAGFALSPVTSVRKLRVEGVPESGRGPIVAVAQNLKGRPALSLNPREFESAILKDSQVGSADFRRSVFGSARLAVRHRRAVARLEPANGRYLDESGVVFETVHPPVNLPGLEVHKSLLRPALTLTAAAPLRDIAGLILAVPPTLLQKGVKVQVDSEGAVCLNISQGTKIDLGAADGFEDKLSALRGLLNEQPDLLQRALVINLTEPSRPALQLRKTARP